MTHKLKITSRASGHLDALYSDGWLRWGEAQADLYYDRLLLHFDSLCENPLLYPEVGEIRPGYRRSVCGKHSIYYCVNNDTVEIMAVLQRQDPFGQLSD